MVGTVTSLTGNGLRDWLLQRVSAIFIGLYALFLCVIFMRVEFTYDLWRSFFYCRFIQVANTLTMLFIVIHAWVGLWTVTTDYLNKCTCLRLLVQGLIALALLVTFVWSLSLFWGV
jgi:succinate dehydrogenase / fumarate reductase membrane anchor subunit